MTSSTEAPEVRRARAKAAWAIEAVREAPREAAQEAIRAADAAVRLVASVDRPTAGVVAAAADTEARADPAEAAVALVEIAEVPEVAG
jgi:hypothetical protein